MQALDLPCNPSLDRPRPDPSAMPEHYSPIHSPNNLSPENKKSRVENNSKSENKENNVKNISASDNNGNSSVVARRERPSRACTQRAAARLQAAAKAEAAMVEVERKRKKKRRERLAARLLKEESEEEDGYREDEEDGENEENGQEDCSTSSPQLQSSNRIITPLLGEPEASQLPRWNIRSMWQLASILNFLNVFRPLLNVKVEFSAEEFETALINPNNTLAEIHMPLLKAIPPVTRMALNHATWITVLCRKLRDWWHWVAEGDLPVVASHGTEVQAYNTLNPGVRVVILKALCDIRVEQEDIRNYLDDSLKHGVQLSTFRKERLGGDSYGVSYWYEDDPVIGQRLYREIRKVEVKKVKGRNIPPIPHSSYEWEAVATNLDEFQNVSEKLFSSTNRTEVSVGKKLKNYMLPEIEKVYKRKEKLLKKQHRQALMLDSMISMDGLGAGRSLRDRKPVTYTFDDYDRSINEALKVTKKKRLSPDHFDGRDPLAEHEFSGNGRLDATSQHSQFLSFSAVSPKSPDDEDDDADHEFYDDHQTETLDRSNRRRQRPQRYSVKDYVEAVSDAEADLDSDDDIVGEVVYNEEYLRRKKRRKMSSSSEGDEEYNWDEENHEEEEEEEEEEEDDTLSTSEDSDAPRRTKTLPGRTRREAKVRSVGELQSGLRRSTRATQHRINYKQYEMSESDTEQMKPEKSNVPDEHSYSSGDDDAQFSTGSHNSDEKKDKQEIHDDPPIQEPPPAMVDEKPKIPPEQENHNDGQVEGVTKRRFLDLNELAPGSGFDDGPSSMRDEDRDEF